MDASEPTGLDPLVQIDSEELKGNTEMTSKVKRVLNVNH